MLSNPMIGRDVAKAKSLLSNKLAIEHLEDRRLLASGIHFSDPVLLVEAGAPTKILAADLDEDGDFDLVVGNYREHPSAEYGDNGLVLLGNGDGTFADANSYGSTGDALAAGDFNGDGHLDLAVGSGRIPSPYSFVRVLLGNGDGSFGEPELYEDVGGVGVTAADLDGDGDLDLAVAKAHYESNDVHVLLGKGDGTFVERSSYPVGDGPASMTGGDLDGDGDFDLVTANHVSNDLSVLLNNGDGTFSDEERYEAVDISHYSGGSSILTTGDLDRDGDLDLAVTNSGYVAEHVSVLLGVGDGTFADRVDYSIMLRDEIRNWPVAINASDVDGDDDLDLTISDAANHAVKLLVNKGEAAFELYERGFPAGPVALGHTLADLDGDGDLDLVVGNDAGCPGCRPGISVLINTTERRLSPRPGDANGDDVFNQRDIVQVLQAGKYSTGQPATFAEGDWNGDAYFDRLDIVVALQTGSYLKPL